jgi:hypothetical protein
MNYGPDEGKESVDHEARTKTFHMEFLETGTLPPEAIAYLIDQGFWAERLSKAGNRMKEAADRLIKSYEEEVADLNQKLATANAEIHILRTSVQELRPKDDP